MDSLRGDIYALSTAIFWSIAVIFFKLSSDRVKTIPLKVFQNALAVFLFFISILILGEPLWLELNSTEWLLIVLSAILGITIGDTLYVEAIKRIGASQQALVDVLYTPFVIVLAYLFFDEKIPLLTYLGGVFVVAGILVAYREGRHTVPESRLLISGLILAILSQLAMAICVVMLKELLRAHSLLTLTFYRFLIGSLILFAFYFKKMGWRELTSAFDKRSALRYMVPGAVLGPFLATLLWFAGFKYALAGRAAIYNQLSTVLIVVLAAIFLREKMTKNKSIAMLLALIGGCIVWLS